MSERATGNAKRGVPLTRRELWIRLLLYPGHTLPTALAPVLVGVGLAIRDGVFSPGRVALAFVGSWLIHLGGVFADNLELLRRHPDVPEHPELLAATSDGRLDLGLLRRLTIACFVAGAGCGAWLVVVGGPFAALIGGAGVVASLTYASGGVRYARFGLADTIFFLMFGLVAVVGVYYIQAVGTVADPWERWLVPGALTAEAFLVGLPVGALVMNVLVIDDLRDQEFDARKGWRTTAVRFGARASRVLYASSTLFAYLAPFGLWWGLGLSTWVLLPLGTLPWAVWIATAVTTRRTAAELLPMTPRASRLSLLYALALGLGLTL